MWKRFTNPDEPEPSFWDSIDDSLTMSKKTRFYGFGITFSAGVLLFFLSIIIFPAFVTLYSIGNICIVGSSFFLFGPMKQIKNMMKQYRIVATAIFLLALAGTLWAALDLKNILLAFLFCAIQAIAFLAYVLTYIPFAGRYIQNCFGNMMS